MALGAWRKAGLRATKKVRSGNSFYISIEGNRSPTGVLQPFKKGPVVMGISGGIAGLGGASQIGDFSHVLDGSPQGLQAAAFGYTGIVVAALSRYNPIAVCVVAVLIGGLLNAGFTLQGVEFPSGLVGVMQGIILFCALGGEVLIRYRVRVMRRARSHADTAEAAA